MVTDAHLEMYQHSLLSGRLRWRYARLAHNSTAVATATSFVILKQSHKPFQLSAGGVRHLLA